MAETICDVLMRCPSFERHRATARWVLRPGGAGNPAVPPPLAEILADARARDLSEIDVGALAIAYAHRMPASSHKGGGVKPESSDARKLAEIVAAVARGCPSWRAISLDCIAPDVVAASIAAVFDMYDAGKERAAAVRRNLLPLID